MARKLSDAVRGNGNGNGSNGGLDPETARKLAVDASAALLADASAGTAEHSNDVELITEAIGERMGIEGKGAEDLLAAARLHDLGKAWIPNPILEKPAPLSDEEWAVMQQHTLVGQRILSAVRELDEVGLLVRHSHERWDGGGYPDRLAGSEIPLGSRIIFCADSFHAIRSDRPYRAGRTAREAVAEINRCAGTQFDPQVAGALEEVVRERGRRPRGMGGSSRLFALLMCLVIGGAGTAIARSGLLAEPAGAPPAASAPNPPPGCGTAACPTVAGPVGGLAAVGDPGWVPGPRPLSPGLPGRVHSGHAKRSKSHRPGSQGPGKSKGNQGKSAAAKRRHAAKSQGKQAGHSGESHDGSLATGSQSAPASNPSSANGGGSSHGSSGGGSSGHGGGSSHSRGGGSSGGASHGNSGGGNGNGHG